MTTSPATTVPIPPEILALPNIAKNRPVAVSLYGEYTEATRHRVLRLIRAGELTAMQAGRRSDFMISKQSVIDYWLRVNGVVERP